VGWEKWVAAGALLMMAIYLFPRAKYMMKTSPKGSSSDWRGILLILLGVGLFVVLLILSVR
jgi:hypothetical protein